MAIREPGPLRTIDSLAASGTQIIGNLDCRKVRTVSISCRVTYNASATSAVRANLYFSPDGENYDTVAYAYFDVNVTAGSTIQETGIFDFPEHGFMKVEVYNQDASYAATAVKVWSTVVKWSE